MSGWRGTLVLGVDRVCLPAAGLAALQCPSCTPAAPCCASFRRVPGSLKVCSRSLFFVPRDVHQPIIRIPFDTTSAVEM